jgi:hypothetical protein
MPTVDGYEFSRSTRANKKYMTKVDGRYVHFGDSRYQHYRDRIGLYTAMDHNDPERRRLYYSRHGADAEPGTAKWFSHRFLW